MIALMMEAQQFFKKKLEKKIKYRVNGNSTIKARNNVAKEEKDRLKHFHWSPSCPLTIPLM